MKTRFLSSTFCGILLALLISLGGNLSVVQAGLTGSNQVVFALTDPSNLAAVSLNYSISNLVSLATPKSYLGDVAIGQDPAVVALQMSKDKRVNGASENFTLNFFESSNSFNFDSNSFNFDPASGVNKTSTSAYNTSKNQWAWSKTNLKTLQQKSTGSGIKVAVLDTGVDYNHPDLKGKVVPGFDAVKGKIDGMDVQGHGTFVAGIVVQVAPGAIVLPVRVLDSNGSGTLATVLNGLQYAIDSGASVLNLSLSSTSNSVLLHNLILNATLKGITVVSAAGNKNTAVPYYPAAYPEVISVAATDANDYKASFSNYNAYINLGSPGVNIYSMWKGGGYAWGSGTSFSAPMVAGASVITKALHPSILPGQIKLNFQLDVDKYPLSCFCAGMGLGRLNFAKLS